MLSIPRPHVGPLIHRAITGPIRRDIFSRFHYGTPLADDQVSITWLGTAGTAIAYRDNLLLIDPYVSRPGLRAHLGGPLKSDPEAIRQYAPRADVIITGHSHHDHIMDVPEIALVTGATVVGSRSTCNLCRAYGITGGQLVEVAAPQTVEHGPFRVTLTPALHGKAIMGRVPLVGEIEAGIRPPLRFNEYRNDETMGILVEIGGLAIFQLGSADFLPETVEGVRCDVLLPCLMGREHHPGFVPNLLAAVRPRVVIPIHFDDFFAPLDRPIRELPGAKLEEFRHDVLQSSTSCRLIVLDLLGEFRFGPDDPALPVRDW